MSYVRNDSLMYQMPVHFGPWRNSPTEQRREALYL